ncbi:MAG: hypothetical protein GY898_14035 [Proteobacteria bacterium]|nr:hypothetical protein [Pseudomonadota bacterium]
MAEDIRAPLAAAQRLVSERRYEDAAECYLAVLPEKPTMVGQLDPGRRKAALHAGICYARAGRARMAVALFVALGERERAAAVLKNAGRRADADRVMKGLPAPDSPWAQGYLHSRPHQKETEGTTGSMQGDPFLLAERYGKTDRPREAMDALMSVSTDHRRYPEAVARAVRLARQHGLVHYQLETFAMPFVREDRGPHLPARVPTLYSLGSLFEKAGMKDAALKAFRATVKLDPSYRDVGTRLALLIETVEAKDGDFARVLGEDVAFAQADLDAMRPRGSAPGRRKPVALPSLPDLPPVKSAAPLPGRLSRPGKPPPTGAVGEPTPDPFYRSRAGASAPGAPPPQPLRGS